MKLNEQICVKNKTNGLYLYEAILKLKKVNPIKFESNWSKKPNEICTKSKSNSDQDSNMHTY